MALKDKVDIPKYTLSEELMSAISHGVGGLLSIAGLVLCVVFSAIHRDAYAVVSSVIYGSTSIILYTMSTLYHSLKINNAKRIFRIIDHCSIFLLIAGTYTPFALVALPKALGWTIFGINWGCAVLGIVLNSISIKKFKKLSMVLYLVMGWMIIFSFKSLMASVDMAGIYLMLSAGSLYTIGAIFYGIGKKHKYMHSVFHFFVLAASILFFFAIFLYVI
ncbi:MAG: hemolysin III family protein [Firmicutes bacterium]|nr:hemolysin III family protein [Bacillota bacterium]